MKRIIAAAFASILISASLNAQDAKPAPAPKPEPAQTLTIASTVGGARYEIVSSGYTGHKTYRIDKTDGTVWIFYGTGNYKVIQREPSSEDVRYDDGINYQLYVMGDGNNAYLVNLNTGIIWYYEVHLFKADRLVLMQPSK